MPDENVRDIVRRVRDGLQEKGPYGAFLLRELDAAISRGATVGLNSPGENQQLPESSADRSLNEPELLEILHGLFETYLITLPSVAKSLETRLQKNYGVDSCEITLDRSLLGDELQISGRIRLENTVPSVAGEPVVSAIRTLGSMARERVR